MNFITPHDKVDLKNLHTLVLLNLISRHKDDQTSMLLSWQYCCT